MLVGEALSVVLDRVQKIPYCQNVDRAAVAKVFETVLFQTRMPEDDALCCAIASWWVVAKVVNGALRTSLEDVFPLFDRPERPLSSFATRQTFVNRVFCWEAALLNAVGFGVLPL